MRGRVLKLRRVLKMRGSSRRRMVHRRWRVRSARRGKSQAERRPWPLWHSRLRIRCVAVTLCELDVYIASMGA